MGRTIQARPLCPLLVDTTLQKTTVRNVTDYFKAKKHTLKGDKGEGNQSDDTYKAGPGGKNVKNAGAGKFFNCSMSEPLKRSQETLPSSDTTCMGDHLSYRDNLYGKL